MVSNRAGRNIKIDSLRGEAGLPSLLVFEDRINVVPQLFDEIKLSDFAHHDPVEYRVDELSLLLVHLQEYHYPPVGLDVIPSVNVVSDFVQEALVGSLYEPFVL